MENCESFIFRSLSQKNPFSYEWRWFEKTKNEDLVKTFNNCYGSIVKKLGKEHVPNDQLNLPNIHEAILKAIVKQKSSEYFKN